MRMTHGKLTTRRLAATAVGLTTALVLSGCGSTVQVDGTSSTTAGDGSLGEPVAGSPTAGGAVDPNAPGGAGSSGTGGAGSGVPGAGGGGGVPGAGGTDGTDPGGTGDEGGLDSVSETDDIEIGVPYTSDGEAANTALGAGGITSGDTKANAQAVIDEINDTGGVAGRKLKPVFFAYKANTSDTRANQDQAACSHFTEDNHIAVLMGSGLTETFDSCMANAGVLMIASGQIIFHDKAYLQKYRNLIQAGTMSQDRMMADQVTTLKRLDYFSGWNAQLGQPGTGAPKIGVLSLDEPTWQRPLRSVLLPALSRAGYPVDSSNVYEVRAAGTTGELAGTVTDVQNATLRFISAGVTHVIILDSGAVISLLFAQTARQQRYYPRWGINSGTGAEVLYDQGLVNAEQLAGAVGLGWEPAIDIPPSASKAYTSPASTKCLEIMKRRTGQTYTSTNATGLAYSACDSGFLLQKALAGFTGALSLDAAIGGVEKLGGSFDSALIHKTLFSAGRHDALQTGFDMTWDAGCKCIEYADQHVVP